MTQHPGLPLEPCTPRSLWVDRRAWLQAAGAALMLPQASRADTPTPAELATRHNNYQEFSPQKDAVWKLAEAFTMRPWTLRIEGAVEQPLELDVEDLLRSPDLQERVYRLRCVEGWSAVLPWAGIPLQRLLARARPRPSARFVAFTSVVRPAEMVGQRRSTLPWPYREGLRLDEATHPLTLLATHLYGQRLPPQNGGPVRLVVPWKYGFKSAKALTHIRLVEEAPATAWSTAAPSEYGFYANVNPDVPHPRWPQHRELRLGEWQKRPTLPFNGYAADVAALYAGMDLSTHF